MYTKEQMAQAKSNLAAIEVDKMLLVAEINALLEDPRSWGCGTLSIIIAVCKAQGWETSDLVEYTGMELPFKDR